MNMKLAKHSAIALALTAGLLLTSQVRAETFAEYGAVNSSDNIKWTRSLSGTSGALSTEGVGGSADVTFSFLIPALASLKNLPAMLTFTGTGPAFDPAQSAFGFVLQPDLSGVFSFTYTGSTPLISNGHTFVTGTNLLSGTYTGSSISGLMAAQAGGVSDATSSGGVIGYSSDFLTFTASADNAYALSLTSVLQPLGAYPGKALNSFDAISTGSFQGDLALTSLPEPATWAMMILGLGAVGAVRRRRNSGLVAARCP
jgi:hypothetical protein